jgi:hypothetical protein
VRVFPISVRPDFCTAYNICQLYNYNCTEENLIVINGNVISSFMKAFDFLASDSEKYKKRYYVQCIIDRLNMAKKLSS